MTFIFLSPIAWDNSDGAHRPAQFARELARRGHFVLYVEVEKSRTPPASTNPRVANLQDLGWDELNVVRAWYGLDYVAAAQSAACLSESLPNASEGGIVICAAPFRPLLELLPTLAQMGYALVYDVLDDISQMRSLGSFCYDECAEDYLVQHADLVIALSPRLREKFQKRRADGSVILIRDGVDLAPFRQMEAAEGARAKEAQCIASLARGEITLGFWGTMWEYNLDVPLLQTLTRARPNWQWHFIGAYDLDPARPSLVQALAGPNVHFHSSVTRQTLARYARALDVCILPVPVTPFNLARDPLKVYEYLACHKPVVATALTQLAEMPYVWLSNNADEFLRNVECAARAEIDALTLEAYLAEQTWSKRTDALLAALAPLRRRIRSLPEPPRGAMPNAYGELDRWQAFARHLERLIQDREEHIRDLEDALAQSGVVSKLKRLLRKGGARR